MEGGATVADPVLLPNPEFCVWLAPKGPPVLLLEPNGALPLAVEVPNPLELFPKPEVLLFVPPKGLLLFPPPTAPCGIEPKPFVVTVLLAKVVGVAGTIEELTPNVIAGASFPKGLEEGGGAVEEPKGFEDGKGTEGTLEAPN